MLSGDAAAADSRPSLDALFFPSSIALLGMPRDEQTFAWRIFMNLRATFRGQLYLVNPKHDEVDGVPCWPSVRELPGGAVPDAAMIMTSAGAAVTLLNESERLGVRAATIFAAGFGEARAGGEDRLTRIGQILARGGMRLCGPNTIGLANYFNGAVMLASANIPTSLDPGPIAMVSQSGGVGYTFLNKAYSRRMPVGMLAVVGNAVDIGIPDYIRYFASRDDLSTIAVYVEAAADLRELVTSCRAATLAGKTVLMFRAGRSIAGARMATSHTGVLAQSSAAIDDVLESVGVIIHDSLDQLVDTAYAATCCGPILGPGVAVYSPSGGVNVQAADLVSREALEMPPLAPHTVEFLESTYPFATAANPYDPTGLWRNEPDKLAPCIAAIANDPGVSALVQALPALHAEYGYAHVDVIAQVRKATATPVMSAIASAGPLTRRFEEALRDSGVPVFESFEACFGAIGRLARAARLGTSWSDPACADTDLPADRNVTFAREFRGSGAHNEVDSKRLLSAYGIPVVEERVADSPAAACAAADDLGYPVVLKKLVPGLTHKSDSGGVRLSVPDGDAVERAYGELTSAEHRHVVVQPMIHGIAELIVGARRDVNLGPLIMVGAGGVLAELMHDVAFRLAPITVGDAESLVDSLRVRRLLDGYRGAAAVVREPLYEVLTRLSWLLVEHPEVQEIDLNPVIVTADRAVAVDALLVGGEQTGSA